MANTVLTEYCKVSLQRCVFLCVWQENLISKKKKKLQYGKSNPSAIMFACSRYSGSKAGGRRGEGDEMDQIILPGSNLEP